MIYYTPPKDDPNNITFYHDFCKLICINFELWCKNNHIAYTTFLSEKGKLNRRTIDNIIQGNKNYLTPHAINYLCRKCNLSIIDLVNYSRTNISTA